MEKDQVKPGRVILIGGSAGSLDVILNLLGEIRADFAYPIVIVIHRKSSKDMSLVELMNHWSKIPVKELEEKEPLAGGQVFLAPADYHTLVEEDGTFSIDYSEKINYSRPSIDVTFETAAEALGDKVVGMLLSGANADGTEGLEAIKSRGGTVVVQDPNSADVPYMPQMAIRQVAVDHVLDKGQLAFFLNSL